MLLGGFMGCFSDGADSMDTKKHLHHLTNLPCLLAKLKEIQQRVQVWGQEGGGQHNPAVGQPRPRAFQRVLSDFLLKLNK